MRLNRCLFVLIFVLRVPAAALAAGTDEPPAPAETPVAVDLSIEIRGHEPGPFGIPLVRHDHVIATLEFRNNSEIDYCLFEMALLHNRRAMRQFDLRKNGTDLRVSLKRPAYWGVPNGWASILLASKRPNWRSVDLTRYFDFLPGEHQYTISWSQRAFGHITGSPACGVDMIRIESNTVTFTYEKAHWWQFWRHSEFR